MEILLNSKGMTDSGKINTGISEISLSGFENILLDMGIWKNSVRDIDKFRQNMEMSLSVCQEKNINVPAIKAPSMSKDKDLALTLAAETVKMCGKINCRYAVIPSPYADMNVDELYRLNREFYLKLSDTAAENKVTILIENTCRNFNGHFIRGFFSECDKAVDFLDELNAASECFGVCCDIGALKLCGIDMMEYIVNAEKYLKMVRIRENNGIDNEARMLFDNNGEWQRAASGLRKIRFDGMLLLDIDDSYISFPPFYGRSLLKFVKELSGYFEWIIGFEEVLKKYSCIVAFGAKNILRNYMSDYGQKYPPLFICDNDSKLWGEKRYGIEIFSPEKLYELPDSCGIIICSVYYREIREQLMGMGLKNIEYFYDEC